MVMVADHSHQQMFRQWGTPAEWPAPITILVSEARRIGSYFELPEDKRPPQALWHSQKKCTDWIKKAFDIKGEGRSDEIAFDDYERE